MTSKRNSWKLFQRRNGNKVNTRQEKVMTWRRCKQRHRKLFFLQRDHFVWGKSLGRRNEFTHILLITRLMTEAQEMKEWKVRKKIVHCQCVQTSGKLIFWSLRLPWQKSTRTHFQEFCPKSAGTRWRRCKGLQRWQWRDSQVVNNR